MAIYEVDVYCKDDFCIRIISHKYVKTDAKVNTKTRYLKRKRYTLIKYITKLTP